MALEAENIDIPVNNELDCYIVAFGENVEKEAVRITHNLRQSGIQVDKDYQGRKPKGQFKAADRLKAKFVLVLGESELEKQVINVKTMETGEQIEVPLAHLAESIKEKL